LLLCIIYYAELYFHVNCVCSLPPIFHGDPRDYAWGADGLDNAITQVIIVTEFQCFLADGTVTQ